MKALRVTSSSRKVSSKQRFVLTMTCLRGLQYRNLGTWTQRKETPN